MQSMKRSKKERTDTVLAEAPMMDEYPWGLRLNLDESDLKKLDCGMKSVGEEVVIMAKAKVTDTHSSEDESGVRQSMSLQIIEMEIPKAESSREDRLYGDK